MLLSRLFKFVFALALGVSISGCFAGPKTRVYGQPLEIKRSGVTQTPPKEADALHPIKDTSPAKVLDGKTPLYVLTAGFTSTDYDYAQLVCNVVNGDVVRSQNYVCLPQAMSGVGSLKKYLLKDDMSINSSSINAQFSIVPADLLYEKQKNHSGPLAKLPTLDVVMFLNGSYLYIWGDSAYGAAELEKFMDNFSKANPTESVLVGVTSPMAKQVFTQLVMAHNWPTNFEIEDLDPSSTSSGAPYDLIVSFGETISPDLHKFLNYSSAYVPMNLSNQIIADAQAAAPYLSKQDVTKYFDQQSMNQLYSLLTFLGDSNTDSANPDIYDASQPAASEDLFGEDVNADNNGSAGQDQPNNTPQFKVQLPPFVGPRFPNDYQDKVFGNPKKFKHIKLTPLDKINETKSIPYVPGVKIYTIGIRNVLVASRATKPDEVYALFTSVLDTTPLRGVNYPTPDMDQISDRSVIGGNLLNYGTYIYNYGITNFNYFASIENDSNRSSSRQAQINTAIQSILGPSNSVTSYGPKAPDASQSEIIHKTVHTNIIRRQQEKTLEGLNSIMNSIKSDLESHRNQMLHRGSAERISARLDGNSSQGLSNAASAQNGGSAARAGAAASQNSSEPSVAEDGKPASANQAVKQLGNKGTGSINNPSGRLGSSATGGTSAAPATQASASGVNAKNTQVASQGGSPQEGADLNNGSDALQEKPVVKPKDVQNMIHSFKENADGTAAEQTPPF